jgi:hypothetical protein
MKARQLKARPTLKLSCVRDAGGALIFTLPVPPSANRWWRSVTIRTKRGVRHVVLLSKEARDYKAMVCKAYQRAELTGNIAVAIDWHRERRSGDLDKRIGVVLDALQGVAYATDAQITELSALRFEDPRNPRIVVRVERVTASPITST